MAITIERMEVIPVAGYDSMLLNLAGAHEPFFTRNRRSPALASRLTARP